MEKRDFIIKDLRSLIGGGENAKMYVITSVGSGKTEVVVEYGMSERFKIQDIEKAEDLYERLTCASGRKMWKLEALAHPYNPNTN